jgi:predicted RNA-binding Zn ribbon-like protein
MLTYQISSMVTPGSAQRLPNADEHKPAPGALAVVQAFANTIDHELDEDLLSEAASAKAWLVRAELVKPSVTLGAADLDLARGVRRDLRAMIASNGTGERVRTEDLPAIRELAAAGRPRLGVRDGGRIEIGANPDGGLADGLAAVLLVVRDAQADGTWPRLRLCANDECEWAFYDRSRNGAGSWCRMEVCGNRLKNRRLRARRARA